MRVPCAIEQTAAPSRCYHDSKVHDPAGLRRRKARTVIRMLKALGVAERTEIVRAGRSRQQNIFPIDDANRGFQQESAMNPSPNSNAQSPNPNVTPVGPGGLPGLMLRRLLTVCTVGFAFPNSFVEGVDLTAIQKKTQGALYDNDKKGTASKSRF